MHVRVCMCVCTEGKGLLLLMLLEQNVAGRVHQGTSSCICIMLVILQALAVLPSPLYHGNISGQSVVWEVFVALDCHGQF
jgi:hypothetical protein